jgi:hypothetical protein
MTTQNTTQSALAMAARMGKKLASFIKRQTEEASDAGDIRIDAAQIKASMARSANLLRADVPRAAYKKDGTKVPMPADLKDEFNPLYKDANGVLVATNYLPSDIEDKACTVPSPAQPLLVLGEVWPVLATVPFMALAGIHWTFGLGVLLAYAFFARPDDRSSFFGNLLYIVFGTSWLSRLLLAPVFLFLIFVAPGWLASAVLPMWMYLKARSWLTNHNYKADPKGRAKALFGQAQNLTRTGYATQTDHEDKMHAAERQRQANAAVADPAPAMDINATATGYFAGRGSLNSPDEGKNMVFTGTDLGAALLAVGTTGTGKTYTVLTPLMQELARVNLVAASPELKYGLFLMDDKGDLPPRGMAIFPDFQLISPEPFLDKTTGKLIAPAAFAPMQGLNAEQVNQLIGDIFAANGEIWDKACQAKFLYTLIAMECAIGMGLRKVPVMNKEGVFSGTHVDVKWNLETIFRLVSSDDQTRAVLTAIACVDKAARAKNKPSPVDAHPLMAKSFRYFKDDYAKWADATRSSVNFNVSAWITDSVNRNMKLWWDAETGVRVEDVFKGHTMGLYCPEFRYGVTGKLAAAMVRARLYNFVKNRSSTWEAGGTRAMLIWDEFALGIGKGEMEANILPIQRSLGLTSVFATQTITEVRARMGKDRADALLDNLTKNIVVLATDAESYDYFAKKLGTYRALVPTSLSKGAPVAIDYYGTQRAKDLTGLDGVVYYDQERVENKQTKSPTSMLKNGALFDFKDLQEQNKLYKNIRDEDAHIRYLEAGTLSMEEAQVFEPGEMSRLLSFNFHAFVMVQRGGSRRFDLAHLGPKAVALAA